jgi:hypothetical protein
MCCAPLEAGVEKLVSEELRRMSQVQRRLIGGDRDAHGVATERSIFRGQTGLFVAEDKRDALSTLRRQSRFERRRAR